jgi:glycosyltransferase involved in cell wall biosynthesis
MKIIQSDTKSAKPLVSVIVPVYNCENYIAETLDSLFAQSYESLEIIVVNDGSSDSTIDILQKLSNSNKIILINQKNRGVASARNAGIFMSKGEYVAFIDSDDYWFKEKTSIQVDYLIQHSDVGAVYAEWHQWRTDQCGVFPSGLSLEPKSINREVDKSLSGQLYNQLLLDCVIHTSSIMIRRSVLNAVGGFDESLSIGEDYDLWLRLSRIARIDKLSTPLSLYRINPHSLTQKKPLDVCYGAKVIERAITKWGCIGPDGTKTSRYKVSVRLGNLYFDFARNHYKNGSLNIGLNSCFKSIRYNFFSLKTWMYILMTFGAIIKKLIQTK